MPISKMHCANSNSIGKVKSYRDFRTYSSTGMMYSLYDSEDRKIMSEMKTTFTIFYDFHPILWANDQNELSNKENVKNQQRDSFVF